VESEDDQRWYEALKSGKSQPGDPVASEALRVRAAALKRREEINRQIEDGAEHGLQRLKFRLRSEDLREQVDVDRFARSAERIEFQRNELILELKQREQLRIDQGQELESKALKLLAAEQAKWAGANDEIRKELRKLRALIQEREPKLMLASIAPPPEAGDVAVGPSGSIRADTKRGQTFSGQPEKKPSAAANASRYALAACLVLTVGILIRVNQAGEESEDDLVTRGGQSALTQVVDAPEARLQELATMSMAAGKVPTIVRHSDGRILLRIEATTSVLDALQTQRLEPDVKDGHVSLLLVPSGRGR
jgi:hypothetical protein